MLVLVDFTIQNPSDCLAKARRETGDGSSTLLHQQEVCHHYLTAWGYPNAAFCSVDISQEQLELPAPKKRSASAIQMRKARVEKAEAQARARARAYKEIGSRRLLMALAWTMDHARIFDRYRQRLVAAVVTGVGVAAPNVAPIPVMDTFLLPPATTALDVCSSGALNPARAVGIARSCCVFSPSTDRDFLLYASEVAHSVVKRALDGQVCDKTKNESESKANNKPTDQRQPIFATASYPFNKLHTIFSSN